MLIMPNSEVSGRLSSVLALFPGREREILGLSLRDPGFRSLCEDLGDAHTALAHFVALSSVHERPEVAEYRTVISELQSEVRAYVEARLS
jgi:hypothetical protein